MKESFLALAEWQSIHLKGGRNISLPHASSYFLYKQGELFAKVFIAYHSNPWASSLVCTQAINGPLHHTKILSFLSFLYDHRPISIPIWS